MDALAAACAECNHFAAAVKFQNQAFALNDMPEAIRPEMEQRLQLYQRRELFRYTWE